LNSFLRTNPSLFSLSSLSGWFLNSCCSRFWLLNSAFIHECTLFYICLAYRIGETKSNISSLRCHETISPLCRRRLSTSLRRRLFRNPYLCNGFTCHSTVFNKFPTLEPKYCDGPLPHNERLFTDVISTVTNTENYPITSNS
jgi:hypothetical protein